ncbi:MAG TPA: BON domain-containing protein [Candidatus Binataceae bacterium]|nr:BON domain-containing protein [Candidatus Binataceae bacterium]
MKGSIAEALLGSLASLLILVVPSSALCSSKNESTTALLNRAANQSTTIAIPITAEDAESARAKNSTHANEKTYNIAGNATDISLESRVEAMLRQNKLTRDSDVHVTADNGVVTLRGKVSSKPNAERIQQAVSNVDGVQAVNNDLNYPGAKKIVTPRDADSTGTTHPAYSDIAPAEKAPGH